MTLCATMPNVSRPLTAKQALFVEEYLVDLNATQAAIRAGYSEKTAYSQGQRLLKHVETAAAIGEAMVDRSERTKLTADMVIEELSKLAFSNMLDYVGINQDGTAYIDLSDLTRDQAAAIGEIVTDEYSEGRGEGAVDVKKIKFKLADKRGSLELLGKHMALFTDRFEVKQEEPTVVHFIRPDGAKEDF